MSIPHGCVRVLWHGNCGYLLQGYRTSVQECLLLLGADKYNHTNGASYVARNVAVVLLGVGYRTTGGIRTNIPIDRLERTITLYGWPCLLSTAAIGGREAVAALLAVE